MVLLPAPGDEVLHEGRVRHLDDEVALAVPAKRVVDHVRLRLPDVAGAVSLV